MESPSCACSWRRADNSALRCATASIFNDQLRLKYRYLDLRRPSKPHEPIVVRSKIAPRWCRIITTKQHFVEIQRLPMLIKSTPRARGYLVPSRVRPGHFYALPQSPQHKQILMLSGTTGTNRRCFRDAGTCAPAASPNSRRSTWKCRLLRRRRDDDRRARRKRVPEVLGVDVKCRLSARAPYSENNGPYSSGSNRTPAFRVELQDVTDVRESGFTVFKSAVGAKGGSVRLINKGLAGARSPQEIDKLVDVAKTYGAKRPCLHAPDGGQRDLQLKSSSRRKKAALHKAAGTETGDVLLVVADAKNSAMFAAALGALRCLP